MGFFDVLYVISIFLVALYAENLGRNAILWLLASIFISPIVTWLLLLLIGPAK